MTSFEALKTFEFKDTGFGYDSISALSANVFLDSLGHIHTEMQSPRNKSMTIGQEIETMRKPLANKVWLNNALSHSFIRMRKSYDKFLKSTSEGQGKSNGL